MPSKTFHIHCCSSGSHYFLKSVCEKIGCDTAYTMYAYSNRVFVCGLFPVKRRARSSSSGTRADRKWDQNTSRDAVTRQEQLYWRLARDNFFSKRTFWYLLHLRTNLGINVTNIVVGIVFVGLGVFISLFFDVNSADRMPNGLIRTCETIRKNYFPIHGDVSILFVHSNHSIVKFDEHVWYWLGERGHQQYRHRHETID